MVMAADLSKRHGWLDDKAVLRMIKILTKANLPVTVPAQISGQQMLELMQGDKKVLDGHLHLVLFKEQAKSFVSGDYNAEKLKQTVKQFTS